MKLITTLAVTMLAALSFNLKAADTDKKLSDFKFAETVVGEKPTKSYLKGKVVILEYWGVR
ncbi:MAG: hypothetical protein ACI9E1_002419 [Cryomorphaceae bacterium]|jgi:hypothetical protein